MIKVKRFDNLWIYKKISYICMIFQHIFNAYVIIIK